MTDADFEGLIARVKAGDESVFPEILRHYEIDVRTMVRARLPKVLRSEFDSLDFVQAVWKSFLECWADEPDRFESPGHLRGFLAGVTRNKVLAEYRRRTKTKKYDLKREESLYVRKGHRDVVREIAGQEPSPSQNIQLEECWDRILERLTPEHAEIVTLRRDGLTFEEIAAKTGIHERAVRRILETVRQVWEQRS